jgi:YbbR domain-containing protein
MRDWLTKDFHWKAFSLLMAIGIWLTVHRISGEPVEPRNSDAHSITYRLPVLAVSANEDVHKAQVVPPMVNVTVSGSPEVINSLQESQVHVFVNLTDLSSAEDLPRDVEVSLPRGVALMAIDQPQVNVTMPKQP